MLAANKVPIIKLAIDLKKLSNVDFGSLNSKVESYEKAWNEKLEGKSISSKKSELDEFFDLDDFPNNPDSDNERQIKEYSDGERYEEAMEDEE